MVSFAHNTKDLLLLLLIVDMSKDRLVYNSFELWRHLGLPVGVILMVEDGSWVVWWLSFLSWLSLMHFLLFLHADDGLVGHWLPLDDSILLM